LVADAVRRVPVWFWLAAIIVGSTAFRVVLGREMVAPFIMVDEVIWSELARGIADEGRPLLRGVSAPGFGVVYPLVISPAYAVFDSLPTAYAAVKDINALVMSLAAVPAYFLARRVVAPGLALLAALLAIAVPSFAYTGTVMTENLFYPLFLVVSLVLVLVLEGPSTGRTALLLALVVVAFATRVQAVAIVPAALAAPLLLALFQRASVRASVTRQRSLYVGFAALGLAALVVQVASGRSLQDLLGAYSPVGNASYDVGEALRYFLWHVEELVLYLLVLPIAATIVLLGRAHALDARLQAFLAALVTLTASFLPVVAVFASHFAGRIQERNMFYLAPLFVIALLAWVERGTPRPRVLAPAAAVASTLLVLLFPFHRFITTSAITDTLMLLPWWSIQDRIGAEWIRPAAGALAVALSAAFLFVPRRYAVVLPLLVFALWAAAVKPIWWGKHGFERAGRGSLFQGIREAKRDWIDRGLPTGTKAVFLWTGRTDRLTVNENEFFNRQVGPVYYVAGRTPGDLPETRVTVDPKTGAVTLPDGRPVPDSYVVADSSFEPDGTPLARDKGWGITLWRVTPPLVSALRVDGLYPNDTWSGRTVTWVRRRCRPGRLLVWVSSDPGLFFEPQTIVARSGGRVIGRAVFPPEGRAVLWVRVARTKPASECRVQFVVTPTAVPKRVTGGENPDTRVLGAHFNRFLYQPGKR
jgi:hypothetical protein